MTISQNFRFRFSFGYKGLAFLPPFEDLIPGDSIFFGDRIHFFPITARSFLNNAQLLGICKLSFIVTHKITYYEKLLMILFAKGFIECRVIYRNNLMFVKTVEKESHEDTAKPEEGGYIQPAD